MISSVLSGTVRGDNERIKSLMEKISGDREGEVILAASSFLKNKHALRVGKTTITR